ncbi:MAG TPA: FecR family protein, partial [Pirellulaceae bacterium]|nr:FecR family protein [Pirellulaceae bacterium]
MTEHHHDPFAPPLDPESRARLAAALSSAESIGDEERQPDVDAASKIEAALDVDASDEIASDEIALTEAALQDAASEEAALEEVATEGSALSEAAIRRIMRTTRRLIAESPAHDVHATRAAAGADDRVDHNVNDSPSRATMTEVGARASRDSAAAPRLGVSNRTPWSPYALLAAALLVVVGLYVAFSGGNARRGGGRGASRSDVASVARLPLRPARFGASDREHAPPLLAIGDTLSTGPREKRRVTLPDGTVVALNAQTKMTVAANRRVQLERGELYVEAAPADSAPTQTKAQTKPQSTTPSSAATPARFIVETPRRSVTALGTKFLVAASDEQTQVVVTQGQVRVSG